MPVQIGASTHSFAEPTGLLSDCHRRVELFINSLKTVADHSDRELTPEMKHALEVALRYFREAAPKHTADEEESLFPRLREMKNAEMKAALQRLDVLEKDHRWAEPLHADVERLGHNYIEAGRLVPDDAQVFRNAVHRLQEMYCRHIDIEDREVFPVADALLPPEAKQGIAKEMAQRRGLAQPDDE